MSDASPHAATRVNPVAPQFPALFPTEVGFVPPPPVVRPLIRFDDPGLPDVPGYAVTGEIARGGMGRVLAAHDPTLDREVAVKVLLRGGPAGALARRFRQEARITAKLPHPGIPPVYALGGLDDGSPFLAMKLIRGRTLAELLHERQRPTDDLPRLVQVFEQVCQAVGFAHAQGIVHRDLKPANVMVGAFGEVQVMDWGLAKDVASRECERPEPTHIEPPTTPVAHAPGSPDTDASRLTLAGQVLGTPAYMAPEQARGEDPAFAADVFALGGILCEILVERPPFVEEADRATIEAAAAGDLAGAFAALDACPADAELVSLATWCLSPNPAHRPADAKAVADVVTAYRAAVEDRLHRAEAMRAAAEAKAAEEANTRAALERAAAEQRKRRRSQVALAAAVAIIGGLVAAGAWRQDRQATERRLERERVEAERRGTRHGVERAIELAGELRRQYRFADAGRVLADATDLAARTGADDLRPVIDQAKADLEFVVALDATRMRRVEWVELGGGRGRFRAREVPDGYAAAFAQRGLDVTAGDPEEVAARIAASAVRADLIAALDDWAAVERRDDRRDRVLDVARRADPDDWLDRFRDPAVRADNDRLADLARAADPVKLGPAAVAALAAVMEGRGLDPARFLAAAQAAHPNDFLIAFQLGQWLFDRDANRAAAQFRAALALRPDNLAAAINLAEMLVRTGDGEAARDCLRAAVRFHPTNSLAHSNLGQSLWKARDLPAAAASLREALRHDPDHAQAHTNLGAVLIDAGDADGGLRHLREAVRLDPGSPSAQTNLGSALKRRGEFDEAIRCFRAALAADPGHVISHYNLGLTLRAKGDPDAADGCFREALRLDPKFARAHQGLGQSRRQRGDLDAAVGHFREAIRLDPTEAFAHYCLGNALRDRGDRVAAVASFREAIARDPGLAPAHVNLGILVAAAGDHPGAIRHYRDAARADPTLLPAHENLVISFTELKDWAAAAGSLRDVLRLNPDLARAHLHLGQCLDHLGDTDGAIRSYREGLRLDPGYAPGHTNLGFCLLEKGDGEGAERCFREAIRLDPNLPQPRAGLAELEKGRADREHRTAPAPRAVER